MVKCSFENIIGHHSDGAGRMIAFCGAGGKTTSIHAIRDYYLERNRKVLVTTTTHMILEEGCVSKAPDIIEKIDKYGYAFAGTLINDYKISAIPHEDLLLAFAHADVALIEADGARCLPFKVPKPWEPVIPAETTDIVLVMGMDAEGKRICDTCYNPEGVADTLGVSVETCLTREMMIKAYMETYIPLIRQNHKSSRVLLYMNEKNPGKTIVDCGLYIL